MNNGIKIRKPVSVAIAAVIALSISTASFAAPVGSGNAELKNAAPSQVEVVSHRHWHRGAVAAGVALGILGVGVYAVNRDRYYHDDGDRYYYDERPVAFRYGPSVGYRSSCWVVTDKIRDQGYSAC